MEEREGIKLKVVTPRDRYLDADDIIAALTPRTRLVSLSLVRFDNGVLLDAARIGAACHAQGALVRFSTPARRAAPSPSMCKR